MIKIRKCHCVHAACYNESGKEIKFTLASDGMLSGISDDLNKNRAGTSGPEITLVTRTLTSILDEVSAPRDPDYLSLDTEGSELLILQGLDLDKYKFKYISVEHNYIAENRNNIRRYLLDRGYEYLRENHMDDEYVLKI
jgi:FkbM family methyltransferase